MSVENDKQTKELEKTSIKETDNLKDVATKDIKSLEKDVKNLQRELKREQRASKTAERLEKEMKVQREDLDNITHAHLVYVLTDKDLIIQQFTQAFTEMFDFGENDAKDQNFKILIQHDDAVKFYNGCEYVSSHGKEGWGTDIKMLNRTNNIIFTHTFIYPRFDGGVLVGFTFIIENITNKILLHKMQVKLLAAEKFETSTLDFISSTSAAVLDTVSYKISAVVKLIVSFIVLFLIYATVFDIDEIARGSGSFIPTSKVQFLKNYEGGVLTNIYVSEGDSVKKGQILVKFNPIAHQSKLDENKIRMIELKAKLARLKAESLGIPMENVICDADCDEKLLKLEKSYYNSNKEELKINISKQEEQLKSKESSLIDAQHKFKILNKNYNSLFDEYRVKKELEKKKIFTKYELGLLKRELNSKRSERKSAKESIVQIKTQIQEIKNGIKETKLTFVNKASSQYNETLAEIFRLEESKKTLEDIIKRTVIRSPVNGVIKELFVYTIGSSIQSSAELMSIVPDNYEMIAEVKIKPEEIAKLHIGQKVKLKVTAFDYSIYGDLEGRITNISPDTITDKASGDSHYLIYIKTKKNYLNNNEKYKIKIGMMVNADILVGKKSIMSFLLKPILKTTQRD
jgi:adhesin transport system membrane fusion protein